MAKKSLLLISAALLVGLIIFVLGAIGLSEPNPNPEGSFSFAVLGDAPYYFWEDMQLRVVLDDLDAHELAFVVHVGDMLWKPCSDRRYRRSLDWFNGLRHPLIYTPGDNEWTDCWEPRVGGDVPLERLEALRRIFFPNPGASLGRRTIPLESQSAVEGFEEFVENARWTHRGVVFATVHLPGSRNGMNPFPGRTSEDDAAALRRIEAATAWLRETFERAEVDHAAAVVVGFHAAPGLEASPDDEYRATYGPFLQALEDEAERFGRPVLVVHGDDHEFVVDHPLVRRTTGARLANLTRMMVPGSPEVGWVRVTVTPGAANPFAFEERVVPRWKYW